MCSDPIFVGLTSLPSPPPSPPLSPSLTAPLQAKGSQSRIGGAEEGAGKGQGRAGNHPGEPAKGAQAEVSHLVGGAGSHKLSYHEYPTHLHTHWVFPTWRTLIVDNFIPPEVTQRVCDRAMYSEEEETWTLPPFRGVER